MSLLLIGAALVIVAVVVALLPQQRVAASYEEAYEGESIRARLSHGRDHAADRS